MNFWIFLCHLRFLGFGWLTLVVTKIVAIHKFESDHDCSHGFFRSAMNFAFYFNTYICQPYLIIFIENNEVLRTPHQIGVDYKKNAKTDFYMLETYRSQKISINAAVTFEMWDYESFSNSLLLRRNASINKSANIRTQQSIVEQGSNRIHFTTLWENEYEE